MDSTKVKENNQNTIPVISKELKLSLKIFKLLRIFVYLLLKASSTCPMNGIKIRQLGTEYQTFKVLKPTKYNRLPLIDLDRCISM